MLNNNPNKSVCATAKGIIISFADANKHKFVPYANSFVQDVQMKGIVRYKQVDYVVFNDVQQKLYTEAIYGLNVYTAKEQAELPKEKKVKIISTYTKAQYVLNKWKQQIVNQKVNSFLNSLFPNSKLVKQVIDVNDFDKKHKDTHSFKELDLTPEMIANKLIKAGLLPNNFFNLT